MIMSSIAVFSVADGVSTQKERGGDCRALLALHERASAVQREFSLKYSETIKGAALALMESGCMLDHSLVEETSRPNIRRVMKVFSSFVFGLAAGQSPAAIAMLGFDIKYFFVSAFFEAMA